MTGSCQLRRLVNQEQSAARADAPESKGGQGYDKAVRHPSVRRGPARRHGRAGAGRLPHRGQLDTLYCDADRDLVADTPKDPAKWRDPSALVWAYTPVEDPAVYANIFKPFTDHLQRCTGKRTVYYPVQSNAAEIEAMRSGACISPVSLRAPPVSPSISPARCRSPRRASARKCAATT